MLLRAPVYQIQSTFMLLNLFQLEFLFTEWLYDFLSGSIFVCVRNNSPADLLYFKFPFWFEAALLRAKGLEFYCINATPDNR